MTIKAIDMMYDPNAALKAISAAEIALQHHKDKIVKGNILVAINYREPSYRKRLYVWDMLNQRIVRAHHCSHGVNSSNVHDRAYCNQFSNVNMSKQTNLGAMMTGKVYKGKHGQSLKLHGLDEGVNDNAYRRAIVIHPADYVTDKFILSRGRAGESWGCPAVDPAISASLINIIKDGVLVYAYY